MSSLPPVVTVRTQTRHYTPSDRPWLLWKSATLRRGGGAEDEETKAERLDNRTWRILSHVSVGVKFVTSLAVYE